METTKKPTTHMKKTLALLTLILAAVSLHADWDGYNSTPATTLRTRQEYRYKWWSGVSGEADLTYNLITLDPSIAYTIRQHNLTYVERQTYGIYYTYLKNTWLDGALGYDSWDARVESFEYHTTPPYQQNFQCWTNAHGTTPPYRESWPPCPVGGYDIGSITRTDNASPVDHQATLLWKGDVSVTRPNAGCGCVDVYFRIYKLTFDQPQPDGNLWHDQQWHAWWHTETQMGGADLLGVTFTDPGPSNQSTNFPTVTPTWEPVLCRRICMVQGQSFDFTPRKPAAWNGLMWQIVRIHSHNDDPNIFGCDCPN
jgi:hypothetical protein